MLGGEGEALGLWGMWGLAAGDGEGEGGGEEDIMICSCSKGRFFVVVWTGGAGESSSKGISSGAKGPSAGW